MKRMLFYASTIAILLTACMSHGNKESENQEIVIRESEITAEETTPVMVTAIDTMVQGPFYKYVTYQKADDNGGYEEYRLIMNLYEPNIPDEDGSLTHGRLSLYVKTPENTEGVKVAQRAIERVTLIEGLKAEIEMSGIGEKTIYFGGTITYDSIAHTYELLMNPPAQLEDLIENRLKLQ